jgi:hypothetical protein
VILVGEWVSAQNFRIFLNSIQLKGEGKFMKNFACVLFGIMLSTGIGIASTQAMTVNQLNITGGSLSLNVGELQVPAANFTTTGTMVMGAYQPPPNGIDPFTVGGHTFALTTHPGLDPGNPFAPPSGTVNGSSISVDLSSLFAQITGPLVPNGSAFLNIGNQLPSLATGTYDQGTGAFEISWLHLYNNAAPSPFLGGAVLSLNGSTVAPIPLPASVLLFGTGLLGLPFVRKKMQGARLEAG